MRTVTLELPVTDAPAPATLDAGLRRQAAQAAGLAVDDVSAVVLRKRSLDARRRGQARWILRCEVYDVHERPPDLTLPPLLRPPHIATPHPHLQPIIVGMGPAGLFAALAYAEHGVRCTIVDRGAAVDRRNRHVRDLRREGVLDPESNLCFGEGGAGTYSDGKLYTRKKSPRVREVYERLVALGISPEILVDAHPHVGTNRLIKMAPRLRAALLEAGHTLRFDARVDDLLVQSEVGGGQRVVGVRLADGEELQGAPVLLATGHSARDTYRMLARRGVAMEAKPFAIGARVEHPQALIDAAQLGRAAQLGSIGPAEYFVAQRVQTLAGDRGVYSFCMCPGGYVLPTPTSPGRLNVNGMSNSNRGSGIANAALVVQVNPEDMFLDRPGDLQSDPQFGGHLAGGALVGVALQDHLERRAWVAGGGGYRAPAQRLRELVNDASSPSLTARTSYRPGLTAARVGDLLPAHLRAALIDGARRVDQRQLHGYLSDEALVIGLETTTSSPVRILRGSDRHSVSHRDLLPVAEGAGYAGGIVSSAIDGLLAAEATLAAVR